MKIEIENISKKFNKHFIFNNISSCFFPENPVAILGANGSGKSTLIKIISGLLSPDTGTIYYWINNNLIPDKDIYKYIAFLSPYSELIEEFTLSEILQFNAHFSGYKKNISHHNNIIDLLNFSKYKNVIVKNFSSGMKQKLKIALCLFYNKPFLFFDEPCSNLDSKTKAWYKQMLLEHAQNRILIVASNNDADEIFNCSQKINIHNYFPKN